MTTPSVPVGFDLPSDRPLRILLGTKEIGGQLADYAAGFRALGHSVTTAVRERHSYFADLAYDVDLATAEGAARIPELIGSHDLFVFQYGSSLFADNRDLPMLYHARKPILAVCNGDDIRHASAYEQEFGIPAAWLGATYVNDPLTRPVQTLRVMERYASLMISVPNQSGLALRPYMHFAYAMDPALYETYIPDRDIPVVVHAPSSRSAKGTSPILQSLERLKANGARFDLQLIETMPNAVVRAALRDADIAIDQLYVGYGKFAAEALATGCVAATASFAGIEPLAAVRPTYAIHHDSLDRDLERLIADRADRNQRARAGRLHFERYHDRVAVCRRLLDALGAVHDGTIRYDYYPEFAACRYTLPAGSGYTRAQRALGSAVLAEHGMPRESRISRIAHSGQIDVTLPRPTVAVPQWESGDGLTSDGATADAIERRYTEFRRAVPAPSATPVENAHPLMDWYAAIVQPAGAGLRAEPMNARVHHQLLLGLPHLALEAVLVDAATDPLACRATALLLLGSGQYADARDMLAMLIATDRDGIVSYYHAVSQALAGEPSAAGDALYAAIRRLRRRPQFQFIGSSVHWSKPAWVSAVRDRDATVRVVVEERAPREETEDVWDFTFADFGPLWTSEAQQSVLAPYHAFLFVLLTATSVDSVPGYGFLRHSVWAPLESALLAAARIPSREIR